MAPIKAAIGKDFDKIELVKAEMLSEDSIHNAIKGSSYVIHHASPYYFDNKTREELVRPAVEGTEAVMRACTASNVKRIAITSSISSITNVSKKNYPPDGVFDESYYTEPDRPEGCVDYAVSKFLAEMAAWDYQAKQSNPFEVVTICPVLILGPSIAYGGGTSEGLIQSLMSNT